MSEPEHAKISWEESGVPVARAFDDPYFSRVSGAEETAHVFLSGNDLPARLDHASSFSIGELGFGTGLNALLTLKMVREAGFKGEVAFTSFELYPMRAEDMVRALAPYPDLLPLYEALIGQRAWRAGENVFTHENFTLLVIVGDANETLPNWDGEADAWFLDGFSPAKNPELWGEALLKAVNQKTVTGGTFATYSAAGWVRRNLEAAGFKVEKAKGYGKKRDMLRGIKL